MPNRSKSKQMRDLISRVDEILLHEWDPIGVKDTPDAWDEYSSYAPGLLRYAMGGNAEEVADQLHRITHKTMGLCGNNREHHLKIAQKLIAIASQASLPES